MKKFQGGGGVPRQTTIGGQRHDLAYINPFEADLLRAYGGSGEPGPGGIPAYRVYDRSYNPSTISRDRTQNTASISQQQRQEMDREINRPASSSRPSSGQDNNPNSPSPTELANRAYARANAERARQQAQAQRSQADRQREQQMRARETGNAERAARQNFYDAEVRRREAAALAARNAARAEEERKEAARIAQAQEDARITKAREAAREAKVIASGPDSGGVTSVYQGPRPSGRPSGAVPQGGLGGLTNLLGMIPGVPMLIDAAKGAAGDIQMSYYAGGPLRSREEQRRNLQEARNPDGSRMYSDFEIDEYFLVTDETAERARQQAGARPAGDDSMPYTLPAAADPCPEGYRMDTVTNACVPADDVTGGTPPVVPGFPDLTRPDPVAVPTVVGSSDYTQMPVTGGVPPLLPGVVPMPEIAGPVNRGFMPSEYGGLLGIAGPDARFTTGMPTDIDPFR